MKSWESRERSAKITAIIITIVLHLGIFMALSGNSSDDEAGLFQNMIEKVKGGDEATAEAVKS